MSKNEKGRKSLYKEIDGKLFKTCPNCSFVSEAANDDEAVFFPLSYFGKRNYRGVEYIQSHCQKCRRESWKKSA
ncbi:MAG: hypothetical protein CL920_30605 [Deltaproteobacteria bacterium]|nr:hypothetical protein [Deltaproteobacteria bacterium]